jgi:hypothetical protein
VTLSYGLGLLCLPLAVFVPPPRAVAGRAPTVTFGLLFLGVGLALGSVVVLMLGHWYEGLAVSGGALATLFLMFWAAAPRRHGDATDDDAEEGGGGGGNLPVGPVDDPAPGGSALDWGEFDRYRDTWAGERAAAPDRELIPA